MNWRWRFKLDDVLDWSTGKNTVSQALVDAAHGWIEWEIREHKGKPMPDDVECLEIRVDDGEFIVEFEG